MYCGNRLDRWVVVVVYGVVGGVGALYLTSIAPYIQQLYGYYYALFPFLLFILAIYHMLAVTFRDPGIAIKAIN